jgi:hypothetical protein
MTIKLKALIVEYLKQQPEQKGKILGATQYIGVQVPTTLEPLWVKVFAAMRELLRDGIVKIVWELKPDKRTYRHGAWELTTKTINDAMEGENAADK